MYPAVSSIPVSSPRSAAGLLGAAALGAVLVLSGCSSAEDIAPVSATDDTASTGAQAAAVELPPAGAQFDYQLGGAYTPPEGTEIVVRDSTAQPAAGLYSVCYVNGFQTQPGDRDLWLGERADLILREGGQPVIDPSWPSEFILDTSTADKRERIAAIMQDSITACADKGFDAVEIDNLDTFYRFDELLTMDHNIAMSTFYADMAHSAGMAIAQKNTVELEERGRDEVGFDFAIAETCAQWNECGDYVDVYGEHVLAVEYTDAQDRVPFAQVCAASDSPESLILRDRNLVPAGRSGYHYETC
ncbi:endo alpha-1,4 polygalactosaminidase [Nocardiopsis ansamitocini]|uniref:Glycoside-hydrolase family GH114 TIM-barrel domain-containing protein n=1 Tax=Nocardiopsis ansamitocini TaxID=1670832 RepID=A0A9W6UIQ6_9ACTN|nr:endo alpha-1,4 polygalactosaminidase [Nocardiopsis ansamitocini]GLU47974.1 hypothetical protein Nans01_23250 [Nocardiopsis ansamitocini]